MNQNLIFLPALAQVVITLGVFVLLGRAKSRALAEKRVNLERRALHDDAWPEAVQQVSNNLRNQFQTPLLFYTLVFMLWALQAVGVVALAASWGFVITRLIHAWVHLGSNVVPIRRNIFTVGVAFLAVLVVLCALALF